VLALQAPHKREATEETLFFQASHLQAVVVAVVITQVQETVAALAVAVGRIAELVGLEIRHPQHQVKEVTVALVLLILLAVVVAVHLLLVLRD
jgi:hypothetical protein